MIYISLAVYYNLQGNDKFLGGWILALKKILDPQEISILVQWLLIFTNRQLDIIGSF